MPSALAPYGMAEGVEKERGMDEFSVSGPTRVVELKNGSVQTYEVTPEDFGIETIPVAKIASSNSAHENARRIMSVLEGEYDCPEADFFCMNAAAALYISGKADTYAKGMDIAKEALANGGANEKLLQLREIQGSR